MKLFLQNDATALFHPRKSNKSTHRSMRPRTLWWRSLWRGGHNDHHHRKPSNSSTWYFPFPLQGVGVKHIYPFRLGKWETKCEENVSTLKRFRVRLWKDESFLKKVIFLLFTCSSKHRSQWRPSSQQWKTESSVPLLQDTSLFALFLKNIETNIVYKKVTVQVSYKNLDER